MIIGKTISHYKILEELGRGGMGIVYKAEDTKLKRTIALKFLPPELTRDADARKRFVHESRAAAALNHPNICTIYEVDESESQSFIAMEYIEGQSLKEKIQSGPIKLAEAIDIAIQTAEGLREAHEKDIVHRDIKSANIMVTTKGQAKIMDFGLAKLAGETKLTKTGTTLGTAAYMSPEQTRGEIVDHRSDIWSVGVVLYEILTGQLPFKGDYEQAVVYSIVNEESEPITALRSGVPMELERIINKCLEKDPYDRYQHVDELIVDLRGLKKKSMPEVIPSVRGVKSKDRRSASPFIFPIIFLLISMAAVTAYLLFKGKTAGKPEIKSIAVLPFANLRSDPETDFLSFALADRIIGALAYIKSISVRASSSVRKYENQVVDPLSAGNELKVDYILSGNYLTQANDIRLSVELVHVPINEMIWRESIEVHYETAYTLQDTVSEKVILGLRIQFSPNERERMQKDVPQNPLAYEYYLRSLSYPLSIEGSSMAIEMLKKSIELDSTYAPAFDQLGFRTQTLSQSILGASEDKTKTEKFYLRALSLNDELLSALSHFSGLYTDIGRSEEAMDLALRALKINPNNAQTHFYLSYIYRYAGMLNESEKKVKEALKFDTNNPKFRSVGYTYMYLDKYKKAMEVLDIDRGSVFVLALKGDIFLREGKIDSALAYFNRVLEMEPEGQHGLNAAGKMAYIKRNYEESLRITQRWEKEATYDAETVYEIACNYSLLGDNVSCIRVLRKVVEGGFFNYPFMLRDPFLDPVRNDPEFQRVLALAKEKHESFKKKYFSK